MKSSSYQEIQPERDVSGSNFSKGEINFNWTMDSSAYFNPYKSFIKLRYKLFKRVASADASLELEDGIGMNMFLADNLFQSMKMNLNSVCLSEISDYVPQVASLKNRMYKSEEHMNNYLASTNYSQAYLEERICQTIGNTHVLRDYFTSSAQLGTVAIAITGVITLSVANTNLKIGDTIKLVGGKEFYLINKVSDTSFLTYAIAVAITAVGEGVTGWIYIQPRDRTDVLYHNNQGCRDVRTFECIWRPCLGFYDLDEFIPGCQGLYNLRLTPQPNSIFQRCAIETSQATSLDSGSSTDADNDYVFQVESMNMYILKGIGEPIQNKSITLNMRETRCQTQNITTSSLHQKTFQVHPRTQELTLAYQFSGASISDNRFSASKFKCNGEDELKLRRFWVNYGSKQLPSPIPDVEFNRTTKIDYLTQRYNETLQYTNALDSPEPLRKWLTRGIYFHFSGYSADEKEDRVFVSSQFDAFEDNNVRPNVLLLDHYIKRVAIHIEDSRIQNVKAY